MRVFCEPIPSKGSVERLSPFCAVILRVLVRGILESEQHMTAFMVWNVKRKNLDSLVQSLVREHKIDVLLLVEFYPAGSGSTLSTLLLGDGLMRRNTSERFGVFTRLSYVAQMQPVTALGDRVEFWDWTPDQTNRARFALVHGLDRRHNNDGTRRVFFRRIADAIRELEATTHRRSMVVGDFNANPFESSILSSDGLHAIGIRKNINKNRRHVRWGAVEEDFFYNPMWRKYGQEAAMEAGAATHYWQNNQAGELFWHMLDQVVIRPEECDHFPEDQLRIISTVGTVSLLAPDGSLDTSTGSDHLPVIFHWNV